MLLFIKTNLIYTEAPTKELRHKELDVYLSCLCVLVVSWLILIEVFKALPSVGLVGPGMLVPGHLFEGLKRQAGAETPLSLLIRPKRLRDVTEGRAVHIRIGKVEVRVIRYVQRLCAELELD